MNSPTSHGSDTPADSGRFDHALDCLDESVGGSSSGALESPLDYDEYDEDGLDYGPDDFEYEAPAAPQRPPSAPTPTLEIEAPGGGGAMFFGWMLVGAALAFGGLQIAIGSTAPGLAQLAVLGLSPGLLLVGGIVLIGLGRTRRNQDRRLIALGDSLIGAQSHVTSNLGYLVSAQASGGAGGGGVDAGLVSTLQDLIGGVQERVTNVGKAVKMFGKPLVEISNQISDASHRSDRVSTLITELQGGLEASNRELQAAVQAVADGGLSDEALQAVSERQQQALDTLAEELRAQAQTQSTELQTTIESTLTKAQENLQTELGNLSSSLSNGDKQAELEEMDTTLRRVEREVSGIATSISRLSSNSTVVTTSSAPTPVAAAPEPADGEEGSTFTPSGSGPASSIAGTKKGKGKNVLGAIAKLKNMRN